MKEGYIRYDAEKDLLYYCFPDGSSISLNSSDFFYVWNDGEWVWTKLCLHLDKGWYLGELPELDLQTGEPIRAAVQDLFGGMNNDR